MKYSSKIVKSTITLLDIAKETIASPGRNAMRPSIAYLPFFSVHLFCVAFPTVLTR